MLAFKITFALIMAYMVYRLWPVANHYFKHGPKGSHKEWMNIALLALGLIGFVALLIFIVRS